MRTFIVLTLSGLAACGTPNSDRQGNAADETQSAKELEAAAKLAAGKDPVVAQFAGLPWGASLKEIMAKYGDATISGKEDGITTLIARTEPFVDWESGLTFIVDEDLGLVFGKHDIVAGSESEEARDLIVNSLRDRYPTLTPTSISDNLVWMDAANTPQIMLGVQVLEGYRVVSVGYGGPEFAASTALKEERRERTSRQLQERRAAEAENAISRF